MFVRRAIVRNVTKEMKTKAGMREMTLLVPPRETLEAQKEHSLLPGGRIFTNPITRKPWNDDTVIMRHWRSVLRKAGVRNPYQTRHTYASLLLSAGENPMWMASRMGHSDWRDDPEAVRTLDSVRRSFGGRKNEPDRSKNRSGW